MYRTLFALLAALSGPAAFAADHPSAPKRIYLAPDDHTDYMWSMDEEGYRRAFLEMLDYYLDQIDRTSANPPSQQARWNCDGHFWLWVYERNRSATDFARLISRLKDRHISIPLNALVTVYGAQPAEAVLRGMYYAGNIERRHDLRIPLAVAMENQSLPYGLGALWAGAGAKYSWKGICGCATRFPRRASEPRAHEIYWWQGPDGSRILMKWNSLLGPHHNRGMGGYAEAFYPAETVEHVDSDPDFQRRYPYRVIGAFGKGWDRAKTLTDEFVAVAREKSSATRQVIVSDEIDFFEDFARTHGAELPTLSASFGNEWDTYSASLAEVSAQVRRSVEKLRGAEAMATLVALEQPDFMRPHAPARDQAWINLGLYWDHTWTADSPVIPRAKNAAWHRRLAGEVAHYVDRLQTDATRVLGSLIHREGEHPRFFAFNALGWIRTDVADIPLSQLAPTRMKTHFRELGDPPAPEPTPWLPVHVVEVGTDEPVLSQIVSLQGKPHLRILARGIPPVGYKVFEVRPGAAAPSADAAAVHGNEFENEFYRLTVAPRGAITSLRDKSAGDREVVRSVDGWACNDLGAAEGTITVENTGPVSVTLRATATGPLARTTAITLFRGSRRIDLHNEITRNFSGVETWGFGFNLEQPDLWHEEIGAILRARLIPDGGHYSPRNARYDWLSLNHFADLGGSDGFGVTLSNADCAFVQLGASTPSHLDTATPLLRVLAGGQVDGAKLGIPDQGGDTQFTQRFALQTRAGFRPAEAMRFALEHQNPLQTGVVAGGFSYPATTFSLLSTSHPDAFVWAVKPAEDGPDKGIVLRLWNQARAAAATDVTFATPAAAAFETTHLETDLAPAPLSRGSMNITLRPQQWRTFRVQFQTSPRPRRDAASLP